MYTAKAHVFETVLLGILQRQFNRQRDEIVSNLDTVKHLKTVRTKDYVSAIINWDSADEQMSKSIETPLLQVLIDTGKDAMNQLGMQPSLYDPFSKAIRQFLSTRTVKIASDVNDETEKQLRASLTEGINAGESGYQMRARVEAVMGIASTRRADMIAQTEVARAQSFADVAAWDQSGVVEGKEWFTAHDEKVCPFCGPMDGKIIGLTDNFFNKGDVQTEEGKNKKGEDITRTLNHSYDDVLGAPLHPSCRCVLLPVRIR